MKYISLISILLLFLSCKKYKEDKFFSTYTPEGRLKEKGAWVIEKMKNLNTGETYEPVNFKSHFIIFEDQKYKVLGNEFTSNTSLTQYTQILRPIILPYMTNQTDSIIISNSEDFNIKVNDYNLEEKKSKLIMTNFLSFGKYTFPDSWGGFNINQSIDMTFVIKRLQMAKMVLEYEGLLRIELKKVKMNP